MGDRAGCWTGYIMHAHAGPNGHTMTRPQRRFEGRCVPAAAAGPACPVLAIGRLCWAFLALRARGSPSTERNQAAGCGDRGPCRPPEPELAAGWSRASQTGPPAPLVLIPAAPRLRRCCAALSVPRYRFLDVILGAGCRSRRPRRSSAALRPIETRSNGAAAGGAADRHYRGRGAARVTLGERPPTLLRSAHRPRAAQDTITGFLLAGVGNVDLRKTSNFLVVDGSESR